MDEKMDFLWQRQIDKEKFSFQYTNNSGDIKTHYPEGIKKITRSTGVVELLYPNGVYTYIIEKMSDLELVGYKTGGIPYTRNVLKSLPVEEYLLKLVEYLIEKNKNDYDDVSGLNYSLEKIKEMLNNQEQKKMNKALFKKFMKNSKAMQIEFDDKPILLPFISNISQKKAIFNAINYDVSVIQGPPGTGKTQTILNIICNYIYRNKTVCIVSKNNSAVDNVIEKFEQNIQLNDFSIRMGNSKDYIPILLENYKQKINKCLAQTICIENKIHDFEIEKIYSEIQELEKQYEILVCKRNLLFDINGQRRHIDRKIRLYADENNSIRENLFFLSPRLLRAEIEYLKYRRSKNGEVNMNLFFKAYTKARFSTTQIDISNYTMYQWRLEKLYADKVITKLQDEIKGIKSLEDKIEKKYKAYCEISINIINMKIIETFHKNKYIGEALLTKDDNIDFFKIKNELIKFFPVVVTSLDSICSNIGYNKYDLVIVDETSQADIITCLPALNISKQIVFVGDTNQLSHIIDNATKIYDLEIQAKYAVDNKYCYSKTNALISMIEVFNPPIQLLREHYRCDYNIINFCNKMYYNNELVIYSKLSNPNSMKIMSLDKEKNSDIGMRKNGKLSYFNKIEEKAIIKYIDNNFEKISIITPYGKQEENLVDSLKKLEKNIGTIYKFQGRENKRIAVSTVLTHEKDHCENTRAISDKILNVAVSRAEEEFILFTHKKFFIEMNHNLKHLINYIETYGEKIESNVNSIFSYLHRQIPFVKLNNCYDSLWEKVIHQVLLDVIKDYDDEFDVNYKTSLADVITNEMYLQKHPEFKNFALHQSTHLDFTIVTKLTEQPILAIEVDGKYHKNPEQMRRDKKKDNILKDHNIPVWRIKSTDAIEKEDIKMAIDSLLNEESHTLSKFLNDNKWKK